MRRSLPEHRGGDIRADDLAGNFREGQSGKPRSASYIEADWHAVIESQESADALDDQRMKIATILRVALGGAWMSEIIHGKINPFEPGFSPGDL
jgi:hypothetical protein